MTTTDETKREVCITEFIYDHAKYQCILGLSQWICIFWTRPVLYTVSTKIFRTCLLAYMPDPNANYTNNTCEFYESQISFSKSTIVNVNRVVCGIHSDILSLSLLFADRCLVRKSSNFLKSFLILKTVTDHRHKR